MLGLLLFFEFFKIGLFAIGGGAVTIPFLFDLSDRFLWYSKEELIDMIAVSQATPGPIGVNMATFAGFKVLGVFGGIVATLGLVLPSLIIGVLIFKFFKKYVNTNGWREVMGTIRPAVVGLILCVGYDLAVLSISNYWQILFGGGILGAILYFKKSPIFYIILSGVLGFIFKI